MEINNVLYGGFVVSKNVLNGILVKYSFREKSDLPQLNGWTLYSGQDDDDYVNDAKNFIIINADRMYALAPVLIEMFDAPYGTNLFWKYIDDVHVGFYDLNEDRETTLSEIIIK